jgi:hypothetical protein
MTYALREEVGVSLYSPRWSRGQATATSSILVTSLDHLGSNRLEIGIDET